LFTKKYQIKGKNIKSAIAKANEKISTKISNINLYEPGIPGYWSILPDVPPVKNVIIGDIITNRKVTTINNNEKMCAGFLISKSIWYNKTNAI